MDNVIFEIIHSLNEQVKKLVEENRKLRVFASGRNILEAKSAPLSYIDRQGNVKVPSDIIKKLGLELGGGVVFLLDGDHVRMMTNEEYLEEFDFNSE